MQRLFVNSMILSVHTSFTRKLKICKAYFKYRAKEQLLVDPKGSKQPKRDCHAYQDFRICFPLNPFPYGTYIGEMTNFR